MIPISRSFMRQMDPEERKVILKEERVRVFIWVEVMLAIPEKQLPGLPPTSSQITGAETLY